MLSYMLSHMLSIHTADDQPRPRRAQKAHRSLLPIELQLDAFLSGIHELETPGLSPLGKHSTWNTSIPGCNWYGVQCDAFQMARKIDWRGRQLEGTPSWTHLPVTLSWFLLGSNWGINNKCNGEVPFDTLPQGLTRLDLSKNQFSGYIGAGDLPKTLTRLLLNNNHFTGMINWSALPRSLCIIDISGNRLDGTLNCAVIPPNLLGLDISNNEFVGKLALEEFPTSLLLFKARNNSFTGTPRFDNLPPRMKCLQLWRNRLSGHVDVSRLPRGMSELSLQENNIESYSPQSLPKCVSLFQNPAWKSGSRGFY